VPTLTGHNPIRKNSSGNTVLIVATPLKLVNAIAPFLNATHAFLAALHLFFSVRKQPLPSIVPSLLLKRT